jgi:hypothetical protein
MAKKVTQGRTLEHRAAGFDRLEFRENEVDWMRGPCPLNCSIRTMTTASDQPTRKNQISNYHYHPRKMVKMEEPERQFGKLEIKQGK